jgi:hypothetical protein
MWYSSKSAFSLWYAEILIFNLDNSMTSLSGLARRHVRRLKEPSLYLF